MEISGAEHKPGANGNVDSAVKQHANTTDYDLHPDYASVLAKRKKQRQKAYIHLLHSFLDKSSVNEKAPFSRAYASLVSSPRSNGRLSYTFAEYISLKKTAESGRKLIKV